VGGAGSRRVPLTQDGDALRRAVGRGAAVGGRAVVEAAVPVPHGAELVAGARGQRRGRALPVPGEGEGPRPRGHRAAQHQAVALHQLPPGGLHRQGHPRDRDPCGETGRDRDPGRGGGMEGTPGRGGGTQPRTGEPGKGGGTLGGTGGPRRGWGDLERRGDRRRVVGTWGGMEQPQGGTEGPGEGWRDPKVGWRYPEKDVGTRGGTWGPGTPPPLPHTHCAP